MNGCPFIRNERFDMKELANISAFTSLMNQECCSVTNRESVSPDKFNNLVTRSGWGKAALVSLLLSGVLGSGGLGMRYMNTHKGAGDKFYGGHAAQAATDNVNKALGAVPITKAEELKNQLIQAEGALTALQDALQEKVRELQEAVDSHMGNAAAKAKEVAELRQQLSVQQKECERLQHQLDEAGAERDSWRLKAVVGDPEDSSL